MKPGLVGRGGVDAGLGLPFGGTSLLGRGPSRLRSFDGQCSLVERPNQRNTRSSEFQLDRRANRLGPRSSRGA
jgi:hypothetical protein